MGEEEKLDEIKKILQDACDRYWEDESLYATASIAANGLYWRGKEIERLRAALAQRAEVGTLKDDVPLRCEVVDGAIQFVIGAKVLAHATNINPEFYDADKDRGLYEVTDPALFAKGVAHWINKEDELGNTRLTRMLDAAITEAIEQGEEGVIERTDGPHE